MEKVQLNPNAIIALLAKQMATTNTLLNMMIDLKVAREGGTFDDTFQRLHNQIQSTAVEYLELMQPGASRGGLSGVTIEDLLK